MRKQKPFFSTLEEIDLDISDGELGKEDRPSTEVRIEPVTEKIDVRSSTAAVTEPLSHPPKISEIQILKKPQESIPLPKALTKPDTETIVVQPSVAVATASLPNIARKIGVCISDAPFVYIPPGTFIMGSPEHEQGREIDERQHKVTLTKGYFIQTTPVTQEQWQEVMGRNPSYFLHEGEGYPVESVSLNDCLEFIWRVNNKRNYPYRLPTEAEWEYACRAGTTTSFFNGEIAKNLLLLDPYLDAIGWYCGNSGNSTHPVAEKQQNGWGLFDMHGNVCEWCRDQYEEYPVMPQIDPKRLTFGRGCVARGGSWQGESRNCRAASRFCYPPDFRSNFVGFRMVREP